MKLAIILLAMSLAAAEVPRLAVPLVRQQKNGCGAASVAMVAQYWEPARAPSHSEIYAALIDADGKGIELSRMKQYFEQLGFRAFTVRGTWTDLERHLEKGRPLIVALRNPRTTRLHFAVLTGLETGSVWLNDPTKKSPQRRDRAKFEKEWSAAERWMLLATPAASK